MEADVAIARRFFDGFAALDGKISALREWLDPAPMAALSS